MQYMKEHFKPDYAAAIAQPQCVFQGEKYRISILSDVLVRLEYSDTGYFEDRPTEFAIWPLFFTGVFYLLFVGIFQFHK